MGLCSASVGQAGLFTSVLASSAKCEDVFNPRVVIVDDNGAFVRKIQDAGLELSASLGSLHRTQAKESKSPTKNVAKAEIEKQASVIEAAEFVSIFDPADVESALGRLSKENREDKRQIALYEQMLLQGPQRFLIKPVRPDMLDVLGETMPNYMPVLESLKRYIAMSADAGSAFRLPPIILLGDPGVGKTFFAKALAERIGTSFDFVSMSSLTAGWILSGANSGWSKADMGKVARALVEKDFANPVILIDEIDKANSQAKNYDPLGSLYILWEREDARKFTDEFLNFPIDASNVIWIATANDKHSIPEPILNRSLVFHIKPPTKDQMRIVVENTLRLALAKEPGLKFSTNVSEEVHAAVGKYTPRDVRKLIEYAIGNAILNKRRVLTAQDIDKSILETDKDESKGIGFVR